MQITLHKLMVIELVRAVDPSEHIIERDAHALYAQHIQKAIAKRGATFVVNIEPNNTHLIDIYV
jgi:hypothetical protein